MSASLTDKKPKSHTLTSPLGKVNRQDTIFLRLPILQSTQSKTCQHF